MEKKRDKDFDYPDEEYKVKDEFDKYEQENVF